MRVFKIYDIRFMTFKRLWKSYILNPISQILYGIMISCLFFACSSSHKSLSTASGKHNTQVDDDKFKGLYYNGLKQKILGNYDDAMGFFRECLVVNPASPAANFEVSEILDYNKRPDSSLAYIIKAVNGDPGNIWYRYFYAQNLQDLRRYKDVVKVYEDLIKMHPSTSELYYKLALAQLQAGEYKEAIDTYNTMQQKLDITDPDISMSKIEVFEKTKDYAKAEEEIQKLIKADPSTAQNYDMLGNLYELEGKKDKAFEEYQEIEKINPHDPMVHLSLADYYKTTNQDAKAFEELEKAFEEPSLDIDTKVRVILGLNTFTNTDSIFNEAMTLSRIMVKSDPTQSKAHAVYGEMLEHNQNLDEARKQYRLAVNGDSSKANYWNALLNIEAELNDSKDLETESSTALALFPNTAQFYYYNGAANIQLKNFDAALTAFKSGIFYVENDSNLLETFYQNIGDASYYTRQYSASDSAYEEALLIQPNNDYVLNNYSYYLSVRDTNLALAEAMSKKSNQLRPNNDAYEDTYGWILYMAGKYQDAKDWEYKAILDGGDRDVTILEHYGDILFKLGDKDSALEYWMKAKQGGANSDLLEREIKDKQLYEK
jgi:tetratricopeptide (TPR) repeat protein